MMNNYVWCLLEVPDESGDGIPRLFSSKRKVKIAFEKRILEVYDGGIATQHNGEGSMQWKDYDGIKHHLDILQKRVY